MGISDFLSKAFGTSADKLQEENERLRKNYYSSERKKTLLLKELTKYQLKIKEYERIILILDKQLKLKNKSNGKPTIPTWITKNLMFMIKCCHPDRNNNSPESTEVTRKLLELRKL